MSSMFSIINHRVGEGGARHGSDVLRLNQLLRLNGYDGAKRRPRIDAHKMIWDKASERALVDFRERQISPTMLMHDDSLLGPGQNDQPFIMPHDRILFDLALGAGVLIRLAPGGQVYRGAIAFEDVHKWCEDNCKGFAWDHAVWGLKDYPMYAIVTTAPDSTHHFFDLEAPRALNCTLSNVSKSGKAHHLAHERYRYPMRDARMGLEEVEAEVRKHPRRLYCVEPGEEVWHMALLFNGQVFECSPGKHLTSNCHRTSLSAWIERHGEVWLSGPSPPR